MPRTYATATTSSVTKSERAYEHEHNTQIESDMCIVVDACYRRNPLPSNGFPGSYRV